MTIPPDGADVKLLGGPFDGAELTAYKPEIYIPRQYLDANRKPIFKVFDVYHETTRAGFYRYVKTRKEIPVA